MKNLLFQVIKSWQVIAVSVALILYMSLVSYAARTHHKPASVSKTKPKKKEKNKAAEKPAAKQKAKPGSKEPEDDEVTEQD
ncbi:MAG: hypothetical protein LBU85_05355 [Treponema sp.]|nr:hypothetical protein [Treponema sp.]